MRGLSRRWRDNVGLLAIGRSRLIPMSQIFYHDELRQCTHAHSSTESATDWQTSYDGYAINMYMRRRHIMCGRNTNDTNLCSKHKVAARFVHIVRVRSEPLGEWASTRIKISVPLCVSLSSRDIYLMSTALNRKKHLHIAPGRREQSIVIGIPRNRSWLCNV